VSDTDQRRRFPNRCYRDHVRGRHLGSHCVRQMELRWTPMLSRDVSILWTKQWNPCWSNARLSFRAQKQHWEFYLMKHRFRAGDNTALSHLYRRIWY
jgi:hypothetical protein